MDAGYKMTSAVDGQVAGGRPGETAMQLHARTPPDVINKLWYSSLETRDIEQQHGLVAIRGAFQEGERCAIDTAIREYFSVRRTR